MIKAPRFLTDWIRRFLATDPARLADACSQYVGADDICIQYVSRYIGYNPSAKF